MCRTFGCEGFRVAQAGQAMPLLEVLLYPKVPVYGVVSVAP